MNDLLKLLDLTGKDIDHILNVADQMKYNQKHLLFVVKLQKELLDNILITNKSLVLKYYMKAMLLK